MKNLSPYPKQISPPPSKVDPPHPKKWVGYLWRGSQDFSSRFKYHFITCTIGNILSEVCSIYFAAAVNGHANLFTCHNKTSCCGNCANVFIPVAIVVVKVKKLGSVFQAGRRIIPLWKHSLSTISDLIEHQPGRKMAMRKWQRLLLVQSQNGKILSS